MMRPGLPNPAAFMPTPAVAHGSHVRTRDRAGSGTTRASLRDSLPVQAVVTFGLFVVLWRIMLGYMTLPESSYHAFSMLARSIHWPPVWLIATFLGVPMFLTWRQSRWSSVDETGRLRPGHEPLERELGAGWLRGLARAEPGAAA